MENILHMGLCYTKLLLPAMAKGEVKAPRKQLWCTCSVLSLVFPAMGILWCLYYSYNYVVTRGKKNIK